MDNKIKFGQNSNIWVKRICGLNLNAIFIILLSVVFSNCNKDTELVPGPVYGPVVNKLFGEVPALVQEVSFRSNGFSIVGDFRTPIDGGVHPAIIMVHGSGNATRNGAVPFEPLIEIFIKNGFSVLSWDKPGSGGSKGSFDPEYKLTQRAHIVADAVKLLIDNPMVNHSSIGLWGISAAGWVMPLTLELTDNVAFMIVVSGGGEDSIEQYAYQVAQVVACNGGSDEDVQAVELNWSQMAKALEYSDYRKAVDILVNIPGVTDYTGLAITEEDQWNPWPRDIDAFFDPMDVIKHTSIPMLVYFGELDKNIDPIQGAQAYESALQEAGNQNCVIMIIENVGHILTPANTGCLDEPVSAEYTPEYLSTLEDWLLTKILK